MQHINFQGHEFLKFYDSPHQSYSLMRYPANLDQPSRITICTGRRFANGFITYVGCKDESDAEDTLLLLQSEFDAIFRNNGNDGVRYADRLFHRDRASFPYEIKCRNLKIEDVIEIANHW